MTRAIQLAVTCLVLLQCNWAAADLININAVNSTYTQDFDGLVSTGSGTFVDGTTISGWTVNSEEMDENFGEYFANTGSSNGGEVYSYGSAGSSDRALGYLGSNGNDYFNAAAIFKNNTGGTIDQVVISYTGEQWRSGGNTDDNRNVLEFAWQAGSAITVPASTSTSGWTTVSALQFSAPNPNVGSGPLDGNASGNQTAFTNVTLSGLSWLAGEELAVRWIGNNGAGADAGLAIDDFSFTAVPEPSSLALFGIGACFAGFGRRRRGEKQQRATA